MTGVNYDSQNGALILGMTKNTSAKYSYGRGTYNLSGGLLTGSAPAGMGGNLVGEEYIGASGTGTFNQTGGTNICPGAFSVEGYGEINPGSGGQGFYNLSARVIERHRT